MSLSSEKCFDFFLASDPIHAWSVLERHAHAAASARIMRHPYQKYVEAKSFMLLLQVTKRTAFKHPSEMYKEAA